MFVIAPYYRTIMAARPGSVSRSEAFFPHRPKESRDNSALLKDSEFLGIAVQVAIVQSNVVDVYNSLIPDLNKIISLLDKELDD